MARRGGVEIDISLLGAESLRRQFKALPLKTQKKLLRKSFRKSAKNIQREAKAIVPVSSPDALPIGHIRSLIKVRAQPRSRRSIGVRIGYFQLDPEPGKGRVPVYVEFGRRDRPNVLTPHLRPALKRNRTRWLRAVASDLSSLMREESTRVPA